MQRDAERIAWLGLIIQTVGLLGFFFTFSIAFLFLTMAGCLIVLGVGINVDIKNKDYNGKN